MADARTLADLCENRAKTETRIDTFVGNGPDKATRDYVVLYPSRSKLASSRQSGSQGDHRFTLRAVCVGLYKPSNCLRVVNLVSALFCNWSPVPDEDTSWLEEMDDDPPLLRDDSVPGDVRYSLTLRYTLTTRS